MIGCFVTGTDTGVGKTLVAASLLRALSWHHRRVVGMKPVAAGVVWVGDRPRSEDATMLRTASTIEVPAELDNPVLLHDPLSPHIAAERAGVQIDVDHIVECYHKLASLADAVVVEGAGGFLVPLSETVTGADLAMALDLPVVLVVGLRLGCLNHAALSAEAIRARGLKLAGWVANRIDPAMDAPEDNIAWLRLQLAVPQLGDIPYLSRPEPRTVNLNLPPAWT
jgi:dethiobiotin synthetase